MYNLQFMRERPYKGNDIWVVTCAWVDLKVVHGNLNYFWQEKDNSMAESRVTVASFYEFQYVILPYRIYCDEDDSSNSDYNSVLDSSRYHGQDKRYANQLVEWMPKIVVL